MNAVSFLAVGFGAFAGAMVIGLIALWPMREGASQASLEASNA